MVRGIGLSERGNRLLAARDNHDETAELMASFLGCLVASTLLVGMMVYFAVVYGWVLSILWNWFVPALISGAPVMSIPVGIGMALIVRMLVHVDTTNLQTKEQDTGTKVAAAIGHLASPFAMLLLGWLAHLLV